MTLKYKITDESMEHKGRTLWRIKASKSFSDVKAGDLGGWVQTARNLSQEGDCWIYDDAKVYDQASVEGDARANDTCEIYEYAGLSLNAWASDSAKIHGRVFIAGDITVSLAADFSGDTILS